MCVWCGGVLVVIFRNSIFIKTGRMLVVVPRGK